MRKIVLLAVVLVAMISGVCLAEEEKIKIRMLSKLPSLELALQKEGYEFDEDPDSEQPFVTIVVQPGESNTINILLMWFNRKGAVQNVNSQAPTFVEQAVKIINHWQEEIKE